MADSTILTLTSAEPGQSKFVLYNPTQAVDSSKGLSITFDFYAYGGTQPNGADGIGFFFIDGSKTPTQPGGFGGSLGYAQILNTGTPGLEGGYLGIGFDEYGSFSSTLDPTPDDNNPADGERIDGPGGTRDSIAVRGSQATNYKYLKGTDTLPLSLDNPDPAATRETSKRTAKIDLSPTGQLTVYLDLNQNGVIEAGEQVLNFNVIDSNNGPLPASFKFGFAASTGGFTNIHEVGNFKITAFDGSDLGLNAAIDVINPNTGNKPNDGVTFTQQTGGTLTGTTGNDTIVGSAQADVLTGNRGGDRFVFSGATKQAALRSSTLKNLDQVKDFNFVEGDRFQLDFDNNLSTVELPKKVFNAGILKGSLANATKKAYADKNFKTKGNQALKPNEAVFFRLGKRTYLSVNDNKAGFSPQNDLLVNVTGISFKSGDATRGALTTSNYFV